jgi:hypothetical protein
VHSVNTAYLRHLSFNPELNKEVIDQIGEVMSPDTPLGSVYGNFALSLSNGNVNLAINFHSGFAPYAQCKLESLSIKMTSENYAKLLAKETVPVKYFSYHRWNTFPGRGGIDWVESESTLSLLE